MKLEPRFFMGLTTLLLVVSGLCYATDGSQRLTYVQGEMAGEVTVDSVVLQSRFTTGTHPYAVTQTASGSVYVPGRPGVAGCEIPTHEDFADAFLTQWMLAVPERDFIVKTRVTGLEPGTRYYYRLVYDENTEEIEEALVIRMRN